MINSCQAPQRKLQFVWSKAAAVVAAGTIDLESLGCVPDGDGVEGEDVDPSGL